MGLLASLGAKAHVLAVAVDEYCMGKTNSFQSRAVLRSIEAGSSAMCVTCDEQVKFKAKVKAHQVVCNVYVDGKWNRVEHYHLDCYAAAGEPYGEPLANVPTRVTTAA